MNLKSLFNNIFRYTPKDNYQFSILEDAQITHQEDFDNETDTEKVNIFPSLNVNMEYMKTREL